jgi:hypothetical protein
VYQACTANNKNDDNSVCKFLAAVAADLSAALELVKAVTQPKDAEEAAELDELSELFTVKGMGTEGALALALNSLPLSPKEEAEQEASREAGGDAEGDEGGQEEGQEGGQAGAGEYGGRLPRTPWEEVCHLCNTCSRRCDTCVTLVAGCVKLV